MHEELSRLAEDVRKIRDGKEFVFFPKEFRLRTVKLIDVAGSVPKLSKLTGLSPGTIYDWRTKIEKKSAKKKIFEVTVTKNNAIRIDINKNDIVVGIENLSTNDVVDILCGVL
jgi:transposase-like protein